MKTAIHKSEKRKSYMFLNSAKIPFNHDDFKFVMVLNVVEIHGDAVACAFWKL